MLLLFGRRDDFLESDFELSEEESRKEVVLRDYDWQEEGFGSNGGYFVLSRSIICKRLCIHTPTHIHIYIYIIFCAKIRNVARHIN